MFVVGSHADNAPSLYVGNPWTTPESGTLSKYSGSTVSVSVTLVLYTDADHSSTVTRTFSSVTTPVNETDQIRFFSGEYNYVALTSYSSAHGASSGVSYNYMGVSSITFNDDIENSVLLAYMNANFVSSYVDDPTEDLMSDVGDVLSEILTDVGDVANTIVSNPVLLVMCIGLPIISVVCGLLARLKDRT